MNPKEKTYKKVLVRNTEQALPTVKVSDLKPDKKPLKPPKEPKTLDEVSAISKFDDPQIHSSKQITQKMRTVDKLGRKKVKGHLDRNQHLILDEKITKQVNFPHEQPIYKDLIPLCVKMQSQPMILSREPLPLKDKEPVLSDFFTPRKIPDYTCKVSNQTVSKGQVQQYRGLKLHGMMRSWSPME